MRNILTSLPAIMAVADGGKRFLKSVHWLVLVCSQRSGGTADANAKRILRWAATSPLTHALTAIPKTLLAGWKMAGQNLLAHQWLVALPAGLRALALHTITIAHICLSSRNAVLPMESGMHCSGLALLRP
jgi:hypothetical protein